MILSWLVAKPCFWQEFDLQVLWQIFFTGLHCHRGFVSERSFEHLPKVALETERNYSIWIFDRQGQLDDDPFLKLNRLSICQNVILVADAYESYFPQELPENYVLMVQNPFLVLRSIKSNRFWNIITRTLTNLLSIARPDGPAYWCLQGLTE